MFPSRLDSRLFCVFLLLALSTLATAQGNLFTTLSLNPVASSPLAIASGDFNGDGRVDLAVTSTGTNAVSVLLGTGDGNFQPAVNYPVGNRPVAIVAGDFNHDGHLDLAVLNNNPNTSDTGGSVSILIGQGDGTFVAGSTYGVGYLPTALGVGDFNGDGNLDLAVVVSNPNLSFNPGFVTILAGTGNGTFSSQANYGVGLVPVSITVGDFTGDGKLDLAVGSSAIALSNPQSEISILINDGSGGFQIGPSFVTGPTAAIPISIAAADFNGDGRLDLAVAMNDTTDVEIWQGHGDGTFSGISTISLGNNPIWVAAGDVNGDGKTDLIVSNNGDGTLSVLLGNGDETFSIAPTVTAGNYPEVLALADFNGDGKLDIAIVNNGDSDVQVFLGEGNGAFRAGSFAVGAKPGGIATGDFNGDGIPDLAVTKGDGTATIFLGDGRGGFTALNSFPACQSLAGYLPGKVVAADVNGDKKVDLAIGCAKPQSSGTSIVNLFQGNGDGTFVSLFFPIIGDPLTGMIAADINGDGISEFVTVNDEFVFAVNLNDTFFDTIYTNSGGSLRDVAAGDFNGDGKTDLIAVGTGGAVLLGDGTGNFQAVNSDWTGGLTGDFNGDGLTDFLNYDSGPIQVILSQGGGTFLLGSEIQGYPLGSPQALADFDGDGVLDVLTAFQNGAPLNVFLGHPDGTFEQQPAVSLTQFGSGAIAIADFDGNGSPDVAVLDFNAGTVSILLNKNTFQPTTTTLSQSGTNVVVGQSFTLSAIVTSKQGTPSGNVTFKQAGVPQTTVALVGGAAQTPETAPSATGQYGYTVLYTGDGTFGGSLSQRVLITVTPATTSTTISTNISPSGFGQNVTFTAIVKPEYSGSPTGSVAFYSDGQPIGTATVSGGQAALTVNSLAIGTHTIEADYSGDASFTTSLGRIKQKIVKGTSTFILTSALNPAVYGQPVTLTATATNSGGIPTGFVVFSEGSTTYGSVNLSGGIAQLTLPQLLVGNHRITAQYSGDSYNVAAKATLVETIKAASSTTSVTSSLDPSVVNQSVTFTAVVSSPTGVPDGTVTFKTGQQTLGTVALSGGQAQLSIGTLKAGTHTITAVYAGNGEFGKSQGSVQQVVEQAP